MLDTMTQDCCAGVKDQRSRRPALSTGARLRLWRSSSTEDGDRAYCAGHAPRPDLDWDGEHLKVAEVDDPWEGYTLPQYTASRFPDIDAPF